MACHARLLKLEHLAGTEDLSGNGEKLTYDFALQQEFLGYFKSFDLQNVY